MTEYEKLLVELIAEFPKFKIVRKSDSLLMKMADVFLKVITFGKMSTFMTSAITTNGYTVYVPDGWDITLNIGALLHERVHMRQLRDHGAILFRLLYLLLWFPTVFAYYRRKYEQEAYEETMRYDAERHGVSTLADPRYRENMILHFTSAQYFWTWPFRKSIEEWYDSTAARLRLEVVIQVDPVEN